LQTSEIEFADISNIYWPCLQIMSFSKIYVT